MKVFKDKSGNYFYEVNSNWTNAPKPNKYLPDRADLCASKTLQQQIVFLTRPLPSCAYLSSGCKQHWANTELCSHFLYSDTIILGTRAGICNAWRTPSSLTDCCQCALNSPLPELSWCLVCLPSLPTPLLITDDHCGVGILLPHLLLTFPWVEISSLYAWKILSDGSSFSKNGV